MTENEEKTREPTTILGQSVGTATGWDQVDDWAIVLYGFEPYEGFSMSPGDLTVDYERGILTTFDDAGNVIEGKPILTVLNGFVAREHHNKNKLANANASD